DVVTGAGHDEAVKEAQERPAFRVESENLVALLGLPHKPNGVYTLNDLRPATRKLIDEGKRVMDVPPKEQGPDDKKLAEMFRQLAVFANNAEALTPHKVFRIENDQVVDLL